MERIFSVKHIAERYDCTLQCARNYIRRIDGHLEAPIGVYESDLLAWEQSRRVGLPARQMKVPRTREGK